MPQSRKGMKRELMKVVTLSCVQGQHGKHEFEVLHHPCFFVSLHPLQMGTCSSNLDLLTQSAIGGKSTYDSMRGRLLCFCQLCSHEMGF